MIMVVMYDLMSGCGYDVHMLWVALVFLTTQFLLFLNFYLKSYTRPRKDAGEESVEGVKGQSLSSIVENDVRLRKTVAN